MRLYWIAACTTLLLTHSVMADAPLGPRRSIPGAQIAETEAYWISPYVKVSTERWGPRQPTPSSSSRWSVEVRWINPDGTVKKHLASDNCYIHSAFILDRRGQQRIAHGISEDWSMIVPDIEGPAGSVTAHGRTFIQQYHQKAGLIAIDIYVLGELVSTLGPYAIYRGRDAALSPDGCVSLVARTSDNGHAPKIIVAGPNGTRRLDVPCPSDAIEPHPTPTGEAVLLRRNGAERRKNTFMFLDQSGMVSSFYVGFNARFIAWVPGSNSALFETSVGHAYRFKRVDCQSGETEWDVVEPIGGRCSYRDFATIRDYLLISGSYEEAGMYKISKPHVYAISLATGETVACWQHWTGPTPMVAPQLVRKGDRIYALTGKRFSELNLSEIETRTSGWK